MIVDLTVKSGWEEYLNQVLLPTGWVHPNNMDVIKSTFEAGALVGMTIGVKDSGLATKESGIILIEALERRAKREGSGLLKTLADSIQKVLDDEKLRNKRESESNPTAPEPVEKVSNIPHGEAGKAGVSCDGGEAS